MGWSRACFVCRSHVNIQTAVVFIFLIGAGAPAFASDAVRTITRPLARMALGVPPTEEQIQDSLGRLKLRYGGPGFLYLPTRYALEFESARRLGKALHELFGYTLALVSEVEFIDVPAFDGLVLDKDNTVIANFTIKTKSSPTGLAAGAGDAIEKMNRYSGMESWVRYLFQSARELAGFGRHADLDEVDLTTNATKRRYARLVRISRMQIEIFGIEGDRPNWLLLDTTSDHTVPATVLANLQTLAGSTEDGPTIFINQPGALTKISREVISETRFLSCAPDLLSAAE